jgi:hypothetical protein
MSEKPSLFPKRRVHLIGISESLDAPRVVHSLLAHDGIDPKNVLFIDAGLLRSPAVADIDKRIMPETEIVVILNIDALVGYKPRSGQRAVKIMRQLVRVAPARNVAMIGVTQTTEHWNGRQQIAGSNRWNDLARTVVIVDGGSKPGTITASVSGPNQKPQKFELALAEKPNRRRT